MLAELLVDSSERVIIISSIIFIIYLLIYIFIRLYYYYIFVRLYLLILKETPCHDFMTWENFDFLLARWAACMDYNGSFVFEFFNAK